MSATSTICKRMLVFGQVQGVFFRASTVKAAREISLELRGFVRNRSDGSVEIEVEGPPDAMAAFEIWATRGPPTARVDRLEIENHFPTQDWPKSGFIQKRD